MTMEARDPQRNILRYKSSIINAVREHRVVIILGDTGSGKTTQIPQYLLDGVLSKPLGICIIQPWRIGAILAATKVAREMQCSLGKDCGLEVFNDNQSNKFTMIKYVTEDIFLNYCIKDNMLQKYGVVMVDEAHTRSAEQDIILSILKSIIKKRKDIKVVITSARKNDETLSSFFEHAPVISIDSRQYKVSTIFELPTGGDCIKHSLKIIRRTVKEGNPGDILVFMASDREVEICCQRLGVMEDIDVVPLYGSRRGELPQCLLTIPEDVKRRVIVATSVAESIVSTDSVAFVIDCGLVTENVFHKQEELNIMTTFSISKAQSDLRKRLAGRKGKGFCYRLYSSAAYEGFIEERVPTTVTKCLSGLYLKIVAMGHNPLTLDHISAQGKEMLNSYGTELEELKLIDPSNNLTQIGRRLTTLPVDLLLGMALLRARKTQCKGEMLTIASMMTAGDVFLHSKKAHLSHKALYDTDGDHFTMLRVFYEFVRNDRSKQWCDTHFLNFAVLAEADEIRNHLASNMQAVKTAPRDPSSPDVRRDDIKNILARIYRRHACRRESEGTYTRVEQKDQVYMPPTCSLFNENPELVLYHKIVQAEKPWMYGILKSDESALQRVLDSESNEAVQNCDFSSNIPGEASPRGPRNTNVPDSSQTRNNDGLTMVDRLTQKILEDFNEKMKANPNYYDEMAELFRYQPRR